MGNQEVEEKMISGLLEDSIFFGGFITVISYLIGDRLKQRFKLAVFNPLLIAMLLIILFLSVFRIDYKIYEKGASYISYFLTPATICLAVPLYEKLSILKKNAPAILGGILAGILTNGVLVLILAGFFKLSHSQYVTLLPKSITTPIGIGISEELGGIPAITAAIIVVTGVVGNVLAKAMCRLFRVEEPVARGIALGSASHVVGTAKAMEMGETEGAASSLSIVVSGLLTVILAPVFAGLY